MKLVQTMMEKVLNEIRHSDFDFATENGNYHYIEVIDDIETEFIFLKHHDENKVWTYELPHRLKPSGVFFHYFHKTNRLI